MGALSRYIQKMQGWRQITIVKRNTSVYVWDNNLFIIIIMQMKQKCCGLGAKICNALKTPNTKHTGKMCVRIASITKCGNKSPIIFSCT